MACKPHKANGAKGSAANQTRQEQLGRLDAREQLAGLDDEDEDAELVRALLWRDAPRVERDAVMRAKWRQRVMDGDARVAD